MDLQATIGSTFVVEGINVYTGRKNYAEFGPADPDTGIICEYGKTRIKATLENAFYSKRSIVLRDKSDLEIRLVEHPFSASYSLGLDNFRVRLSDGVFPTMDNASEDYFNKMKSHLQFQEKKKKLLTFKAYDRSSSITLNSPRGPDSLRVEPAEGFKLSYLASYPKEKILTQTTAINVTPKEYQEKIMNARPLVRNIPFEFLNEPFLWLGKKGLHGITNKNYLFPYGGINPEGFGPRYGGLEPVRHKILDVLGTLALTGAHFRETMFRFNMTGHRFDLWALKQLMGDNTFTEYKGKHNKRKGLRINDGVIWYPMVLPQQPNQ